jgi:hypothetical protein
VFILVLVLVAAVSAAIIMSTRARKRGPELLNVATKAREVRPFSKDTDSRFAPLPFEREKHAK